MVCLSVLQHTRPEEKKTAKGVKRKVKDDHLHFAHYLDVLRCFKSYVSKQNLISSTNHTVRTVHTHKVGLTAFDKKRWLCVDTVHTHLHGHNDIVSDPMHLAGTSAIVSTLTAVGISHNDLPGTAPLAEWVYSDLPHGSVSDPQNLKMNSHKAVFDIIFVNLPVAFQCSA